MQHITVQRRKQGGFTLLELMLSLVSFSLILAMGYQAISSIARGQREVSLRVSHQESLRAAYRTLSNAVASGAIINGDANTVTFDLANARSSWLPHSEVLQIAIDGRGSLLAQDDQQQHVSKLLENMSNAKFVYHQEGVNYARWDKPLAPDWLVLTWIDRGRPVEWRFVTP